jgi:hypothetical protein
VSRVVPRASLEPVVFELAGLDARDMRGAAGP